MSDEAEQETIRRLREALPEKTEKWLIEKILMIAMKHDIGGPDIRRISESAYQQQLAHELHRCAMAAHLVGEIVLPLAQLETLCSFMGRDIIAMRQGKKCLQAGEMSEEELQDWPAYETYQRYFEDDQRLLLAAVLEAALERHEEKRLAVNDAGVSKSSIVDAKVAIQTDESLEVDQEWSKRLVWSYALLEDFCEIPCLGVSKQACVERARGQLELSLREEIRRQNISPPSSGVEHHARKLAAEVWAIRRLRQKWSTGKLSDQALEKTALYQEYQVYFVPEKVMLPLKLYYHAMRKGFQDLDAAKGN